MVVNGTCIGTGKLDDGTYYARMMAGGAALFTKPPVEVTVGCHYAMTGMPLASGRNFEFLILDVVELVRDSSGNMVPVKKTSTGPASPSSK